MPTRRDVLRVLLASGSAAWAAPRCPPAARPCARRRRRHRRLAAVPEHAALTGVASAALPASLQLAVDVRRRRAVESSAAIVDGIVYVGAAGRRAARARLATGAVSGSTPPPRRTSASASRRRPSPAAPSTSAISSGVLHAVDAATGKARWTFKTGAEIKSSPVVARQRVLIGSYDGISTALDAATGKQVWKVDDRQLRARDAGHLERRRVLRRLRRVLPRRPHRRRRGGPRR